MNGRRLSTLSPGGLEIVRVHELYPQEDDDGGYESVLNVCVPTGAADMRALRRAVTSGGCVLDQAEHASVGVVACIVGSPFAVAELVAGPRVVRGLAYRLVTGRMRAGNAMLGGRGHHPRFARQVLAAAHRASVHDVGAEVNGE